MNKIARSHEIAVPVQLKVERGESWSAAILDMRIAKRGLVVELVVHAQKRNVRLGESKKKMRKQMGKTTMIEKKRWHQFRCISCVYGKAEHFNGRPAPLHPERKSGSGIQGG
jgi:hypothetical protein